MRLIDADEIKFPKGFFNKFDNVPKFYEWLGTLPTVDAVEVVRCKDCKCYDNKTMECCGRSGVFYADDYCSRGRER